MEVCGTIIGAIRHVMVIASSVMLMTSKLSAALSSSLRSGRVLRSSALGGSNTRGHGVKALVLLRYVQGVLFEAYGALVVGTVRFRGYQQHPAPL